MKFDFIEARDKLVEDGLLRCDDLDDLRVYSYTDGCKTWDNITLNSRGIILNRKTGEVVSQPFPKFFNMNQRHDTQECNLPWKDGFRIFKKEDGWLGILYRVNGEHRIATRGSFRSDGAVWATAWLKRYDLSTLPDEVTLLFEIICPITHIVVNYGDRRDLVLLAAYNRHTGEEYSWGQVREWNKEFGFTLIDSYDQNWLGYCRGQIKTASGDKLEGFVIRFNNGLRVKIKCEDYFRRHAMLMHLTLLGIWKEMVNGEVPAFLWDIVDVDYHETLTDLASNLEGKYELTKCEIQEYFDLIKYIPDRARFANTVANMKHRAAMFMLYDGHWDRLDRYIMKKIRPKNNVMEGR